MRSRRLLAGLAATAAVLGTTLVVAPVTASAGQGATHADQTGAKQTYLVLADRSASRAEAVRAIKDAGGTVVSANRDIGLYQVTSRATGSPGDARTADALRGATRDRSIGQPAGQHRQRRRGAKKVEQENRQAASATHRGRHPGPRRHGPARRQAVGPDDGPGRPGPAVNAGDERRARRHPRHRHRRPQPRPRRATSTAACRATSPRTSPRSTARARSPSCLDPVGWDDGGHGTHVAGTVGAAANGFGVSGVAPDVTPGRAPGRPGLAASSSSSRSSTP